MTPITSLAEWQLHKRKTRGPFVIQGPDGKIIPHDCGALLVDESSMDGGTLRCPRCDGDRTHEVAGT